MALKLFNTLSRSIQEFAPDLIGSRHVALGEAFMELLLGQEGQTILGRLGFQPPTGVKP